MRRQMPDGSYKWLGRGWGRPRGEQITTSGPRDDVGHVHTGRRSPRRIASATR